MTRLVLASIVFAILQIGIPHSASAADLGPGGESTGVVLQFEVLSRTALARADSKADDARLDHRTSSAPAARARIPLQPASGELTAHDPERPGAILLPSLLPYFRAPPA